MHQSISNSSINSYSATSVRMQSCNRYLHRLASSNSRSQGISLAWTSSPLVTTWIWRRTMEERFWFFTERRCHSRNNRIIWYHWRKTRRELETKKQRLVWESSELWTEIKINLCSMMQAKTSIRKASSSKIWGRNTVHLFTDMNHATLGTFERWLFCILQLHAWDLAPGMPRMMQWLTILNSRTQMRTTVVPETALRPEPYKRAARRNMTPTTDKITIWAHRIRNTQSQPHLSTRRPWALRACGTTTVERYQIARSTSTRTSIGGRQASRIPYYGATKMEKEGKIPSIRPL